MGPQIEAHDRVEQLRSQLAGAEQDGDEKAARRLRTEYERERSSRYGSRSNGASSPSSSAAAALPTAGLCMKPWPEKPHAAYTPSPTQPMIGCASGVMS